MKRSRWFHFLAVFCIAALSVTMLVGCGGGQSDGEESSDAGGDVIKIASATPLSGPQAQSGESIKLGAQMGIDELKGEIEDLGFKVEFVPQDDQGDPKMGVAVAQKLITDPNVLAVVGHYNSGVEIPASEVYAKENLLTIPIASNPTITQRGLNNIARVSTPDDVQAVTAARYAADVLKAKTMFVVHDKTAYGQGVADPFRASAEELGIEAVGYEGITQGEVDFSGVVNNIVQKKPDVVYFGGVQAEWGLLVKQMSEKGVKAAMIGADGVDSPDLVKIASKYIVGTYYTSMAPDLTRTDEGKAWMDQYQQKFGKAPEAWSVFGYEGAVTAIKAIAMAIEDNGGKMPTRQQVIDATRKLNLQSITGELSWKEDGDRQKPIGFILQFKEEKYPGVVIWDGK
jgi:branched-chain amino acid transport system substrate-binding protein